jgi:segregation and condensation protein B
MSADGAVPELKEIVGSLILGARHPVTVAQIQKNLVEVADTFGKHASAFRSVKKPDIMRVIEEIREDLARVKVGLKLVEVAGTCRFQTAESCGPWVRHLLNADRPHRLSRPALETLAVIAYRQPATRADIEAVRGVNVDHIMRMLLEMQLIKMAGRSHLPGRPMLYATTSAFLEHFGLNNVKELPGIEELAARDKSRHAKPPAPPAADEAENEE